LGSAAESHDTRCQSVVADGGAGHHMSDAVVVSLTQLMLQLLQSVTSACVAANIVMVFFSQF